MKKALFQSVLLHCVFVLGVFGAWTLLDKKVEKPRLTLSMSITHADAGEGKAAKGIETAQTDINAQSRTGAEKPAEKKSKPEKKEEQKPKPKPKPKEKSIEKPEPKHIERSENKPAQKVVKDTSEQVHAESQSQSSAALVAKGKQSATGAGGGTGQGANVSLGGVDGVYSLKEVDGKPKSIKSARPKYPEYAKKMRIEGSVRLSFILDEKGIVQDVKIIKATPENTFENAALTAVKNWRFTPATKDGKAVKVKMVITLNFRLDEK